MKQISLIGSTGSIGKSTLSVVQHLPDRFSVFALAANSSVELLADQVAAFRPRVVGIADAKYVDRFHQTCREKSLATPEIVVGREGFRQITTASPVDIVVSAAVGAAGLWPTYTAVAAGKTVALANKEAMVIAGELLRKTSGMTGSRIIPIDSEHCAIDQCLRSGNHEEVRRLILTASGGPFRETPAGHLARVTPEEALKHPTWRMGRRITIDSATLMNKGLEVIEARWLFSVPSQKIDIMVHPQSIIHSMVEFVDGSIVAQLGTADMRQPIQYALTYPERVTSPVEPLDWSTVSRLDFSPPDRAKFPCISLAYKAIDAGGTAPAVLNAADEIAVERFLERRIAFTEIPNVIRATLEAHDHQKASSLDSVIEADRWAREFADRWIHGHQHAANL
jgi:1-deoxy-D-xylulose-5-phosphate reductoisomerase